MKPRHAAALALVGWVLMAPSELISSPRIVGGDNYMMENFDESWTVVHRYKSAEECADGLAFLLSHKERVANYAARTKQSLDGAASRLKAGGFCIREDDPRLQGN
jgi:hypothetical protein